MPLYPYQDHVKSHLLSGKSVILQAPTGAGKTRAALDPFIETFFDHPADFFPRKCIYSVPMRVLANQFFAEYHKLSASYHRKFNQELSIGIQTGDRPEDPKVEKNLVFTTIDQTLSNFLNIPYGLGNSSANLNAGAVLSSYLVFDELHLFDPDTMLPTTLEMLQMLKAITPFIVMTATFSSTMLGRLANMLDAVVVPENENKRAEMEEIGSQIGKDRRFTAIDAPLNAEVVLKSKYSARRTICICNTVQRSQELYRAVTRLLDERGDNETQVCLIHSRFYKDDRDDKERWIKEQFDIRNDDYKGPPLILIATQVIEVGVDATCDVMHTELAPAASILQRAGRCARRKNETGHVYVYLPRDDKGEPDYVPYFLKSIASKTDRGRRLCEATWEALNSSDFAGKHMSFSLEQTLIDRVHKPIDKEILDGLADTRLLHQGDMFSVMRTPDKGSGADLIRKVDSRFIIIHPTPESDEKLVRNPWHYDGFTFAPGSLAMAFIDLEENLDDEVTPWVMKFAQRAEADNEDTPARQSVVWMWALVGNRQDIYTSPVMALHPNVARYSRELGIVLDISDGTYKLRTRERTGKWKDYTYTQETYTEHIAGLYKAYRESIFKERVIRLSLREEISFTVKRIEANFGLSPNALDKMMRFLFVCHDLGKLNVTWQRWAHDWQKQVGKFHGGKDMSLPDDYMAAHTDFDGSKTQNQEQSKLGKRPPHAGESAIAAAGLLEMVCDNNEALWRAGITAITRHHTARAERYRPYCSHPAAQQAFMEALTETDLPADMAEKIWWDPDGSESLENLLVRFSKQCSREVILYFLLVRVLRLADQRGVVLQKEG